MKIGNLNEIVKMENILCLGKGTQVQMGDNTLKNIESVVTGDKIISYNQVLGKTEIVEVENIAKSFHSVINRLKLSNGIVIECTTDHPIWTANKGWCSVDFKNTFANYNIKVQPLVVGDKCLVFVGNKFSDSTIVSIDTVVGDFEMFDISGGDNHCFFANSILVHDENLTELVFDTIDTYSVNAK
jgi:hypothetical protein